MPRHLFTSESVTEGHPDKLCDQMSDAVLDSIMERDPFGRVACEAIVTRGLIFVAGEISTECYVDIQDVVRNTIRDCGYTDPTTGFEYDSCAVISSIQEQSGDIAQGVNIGGAGDQGIMYGFACRETKELMPLPISLAHKLSRRLAEVRKTNIVPFLRPDGKSQVTVEYEDHKPLRIESVIVSSQHHPDVLIDKVRSAILENVILYALPKEMVDKNTKFFINPTGRFVIGGPEGDTGLTGRKIEVDTYGGYCRHGGGCFSGKDPTKVDRSATYMARYVAKNVVAAGLADTFELQVAYGIGIAEPVAVTVDSHGTGRIPDADVGRIIREIFDFTPQGIIDRLELRRPIFKKTAAYGHFGREGEGFSWELCDAVDIIKKEAKV